MHFLLQFFTFEHLPTKLKEISKPYCELATAAAQQLPDNEEKDACLRKLLEAKDCAVRCQLAGPKGEKPVFEP